MDDLPSQNHDKDKVLEHVHIFKLGLHVVPGEVQKREVFLLLYEIVLKAQVPPQGVSKRYKELRVHSIIDEASGVRVEASPHISEVVSQFWVDELVVMLSNVLEGLEDHCNEQSKEDGTYWYRVGEKECKGEKLVSAADGLETFSLETTWLVVIISGWCFALIVKANLFA